MSVSTKCHGNLSNSGQDILLKTTNVNFMRVLEEQSDGHQSP